MAKGARVRAAGGVLWREVDGQVLVAVVHRPRYDDWSLPKGKLDPGELEVAAAVREVEEETGFSCVVGRGLGITRYRVLDKGRDVPKRVRWWALEAGDGEFVPDSEVDRLDWLTVPKAVRRVTAGTDDGTLQRFAVCPHRTSTGSCRRSAAGSTVDRQRSAGALSTAVGAHSGSSSPRTRACSTPASSSGRSASSPTHS